MFDVLLGASGGIVGVLGALIKNGLEVWQTKKKAEADLALLMEQNRHEQAMAEQTAKNIEIEAKHAVVLAEINQEKETDVAAYAALSASYEGDRATYSDAPTSPLMIWVDAVRGFVRPGLTLLFSVALVGFTAWLWANVPDEVVRQESFLTATLFRLIDALIFVSTSAIGWWFAARPTTSSR